MKMIYRKILGSFLVVSALTTNAVAADETDLTKAVVKLIKQYNELEMRVRGEKTMSADTSANYGGMQKQIDVLNGSIITLQKQLNTTNSRLNRISAAENGKGLVMAPSINDEEAQKIKNQLSSLERKVSNLTNEVNKNSKGFAAAIVPGKSRAATPSKKETIVKNIYQADKKTLNRVAALENKIKSLEAQLSKVSQKANKCSDIYVIDNPGVSSKVKRVDGQADEIIRDFIK